MAQKITDKIDEFILDWDRFIIDKWWRDKYFVPFGSPKHRAMSWIDMAIEFREIFLFNKNSSENKDFGNEETDEGGFYSDKDNSSSMTPEEVDQAYEELDVSKYNINE